MATVVGQAQAANLLLLFEVEDQEGAEAARQPGQQEEVSWGIRSVVIVVAACWSMLRLATLREQLTTKIPLLKEEDQDISGAPPHRMQWLVFPGKRRPLISYSSSKWRIKKAQKQQGSRAAGGGKLG